MPAGAPSGLDRRFLLGHRILRNSGSDTSVVYQAAAFNGANGDIFIAGNNSYVGRMRNGPFGELVQGAALPVANPTFIAATWNRAFGGYIVLDGASAIFRAPNDLSAWTTITPPAAVSRDGVIEYNGRILAAGAGLSLPDREIEFSDDNGLTWNSNPGISTGVNVNSGFIFTNLSRNRVVWTPSGGTLAAWTDADDAATGTWTPFTIPSAAVPTLAGAISDDGRTAVVGSNNGGLAVTSGFASWTSIPVADNPFQSTSSIGTAITAICYVAGLAGFIVFASTGNRVAFIAETDMTQVLAASYLGELITVAAQACVSDGQQALFLGTDETACTLRLIGQLGIR